MKHTYITRDGSEAQYGPRLVGSLLHELVNTSNEPLYKNYRKFLAKKENNAEKGDKTV